MATVCKPSVAIVLSIFLATPAIDAPQRVLLRALRYLRSLLKASTNIFIDIINSGGALSRLYNQAPSKYSGRLAGGRRVVGI